MSGSLPRSSHTPTGLPRADLDSCPPVYTSDPKTRCLTYKIRMMRIAKYSLSY